MIPHKFTALEKELLANNQRWTVEDWEDVYLTIQQLKLRIVRRMQQRTKLVKRKSSRIREKGDWGDEIHPRKRTGVSG